MKNTKTKYQKNKLQLSKDNTLRWVILLIAGSVLGILLAIHLINSYKSQEGRTNFEWATTRLELLKSDIDNALSQKTPLVINKYCYYGENASAYDQGKLRCRVVLSGNIESKQTDVDADKIRTLAETNKYFGAGELAVDSAVEGKYITGRNLVCGHLVESTDQSSNARTEQIGFTPEVKVEIYCDQRSTEAIFKTE